MSQLQAAIASNDISFFAELAAKYSLLTIVAVGIVASVAGLN
ncbi:hypothetical protein AB4876_07235 [Zhongshania guokunii]|uniref:Uncharacterized protein n=1 Tax=Zhongshania guokunii TaxID=641783 RepID=A0ABV3U5B0_9GAMM